MREIRVGCRESKLAVAQAMTLVRYLEKELPETEIRLTTMKTAGDRIPDRTLSEVGGKGLFVKELENALREGRVDLAVHSLKDVPCELPEDLPLIGYSEREDPRDVLVLPEGSRDLEVSRPLGTSSLRRSIQLKALYPKAFVAPVRGNVLTRLAKLDGGEFSGLVLAAAGLKRLGLSGRIFRYFSTEELLPAAGQGILAIQGRKEEDYSYLAGYLDEEAGYEAVSERAFIRALGGGCSSPVTAFASAAGGRLSLRGLYYREDTGSYRIGELCGEVSEAAMLGKRLAETLSDKIGKEPAL